MFKQNNKPDSDLFFSVAKILAKGEVVCLTGAGISCESGIPAFRGQNGLWQKYDPQKFGNFEGLVSLFRQSSKKMVEFVKDFYSVLLNAKPNAGHLALTILEKEGLLEAVVTQNIDNLHQEAGTRSVIELHGNAFRIRCQGCKKTVVLEKQRIAEMMKLFEQKQNSRIAILRIMSRYCPRCENCRARFRIDIVLFGESLPQDALSKAYQLIDRTKTFLIVGSSLVVYPAAWLPQYAKERGLTLIEINQQPSALSHLCDFYLNGQAAEILPELVRRIT
ncbi:MAG: NAD-dependent deacylase [Candidatus Omnitrophica bacterium]|nr:NAD-dependent deacylase [Candidatus Omnitrophota bacterium]